MSTFSLTDTTEDEIQNGYLLYLNQDSSNNTSNSFSIINIVVAEGINALALDNETEIIGELVYAWTATSFDGPVPDPLPPLCIFLNINNGVQVPFTDPLIYQPTYFTLPDYSKITSISFKNAINVEDPNYAAITIIGYDPTISPPEYIFFVGGEAPESRIPLSSLNNSYYDGNIPSKKIYSKFLFFISAVNLETDSVALLPGVYQVEMKLTYTIAPTITVVGYTASSRGDVNNETYYFLTENNLTAEDYSSGYSYYIKFPSYSRILSTSFINYVTPTNPSYKVTVFVYNPDTDLNIAILLGTGYEPSSDGVTLSSLNTSTSGSDISTVDIMDNYIIRIAVSGGRPTYLPPNQIQITIEYK